MTAQLGNGSVIFGDGSVQTTKTPTNVSAFTNDSGYTTASAVAANYPNKTQAIGSINYFISNGYLQGYTYDINGTQKSYQASNCNCNC